MVQVVVFDGERMHDLCYLVLGLELKERELSEKINFLVEIFKLNLLKYLNVVYFF